MYTVLMGVAGAIIGWFLGQKLGNIVKAAGTGIVGSFLVVRGIGMYAPGYPSETSLDVEALAKDPNANIELIGYLAGFLVIAIAGTVVQLRTQRIEAEDDTDDNFENQEESRTCGCF